MNFNLKDGFRIEFTAYKDEMMMKLGTPTSFKLYATLQF